MVKLLRKSRIGKVVMFLMVPMAFFAGTVLASEANKITLPMPSKEKDLQLSLKLGKLNGKPGQAVLGMELSNGQICNLTFSSEDVIKTEHKHSYHRGSHFPQRLNDAKIKIALDKTKYWDSEVVREYYVRPDPGHYLVEEQKRIFANWDNYLSSTERTVTLRMSCDERRVRFWVDGRYFTETVLDSGIKALQLHLENGAQQKGISLVDPLEKGIHLPLNISYYARPGKLKVLHMSAKEGMQYFDTIPIHVTAKDKNIDVGIAKATKLTDNQSIYYDQYYKRTPFDGVPETVMMRVPKKFYTYAYVLCAVEESSDKDPIICTRLSRYFGHHKKRGRGNAVAETYTRISREKGKPAPSIKEVGYVVIKDQLRQKKIPLWLVKIFLNAGEISDLILMKGMEDEYQGDEHPWGMTTDYLDLEFTGELTNYLPSSPKAGNFGRRPMGKPSAVHIFGLTLQSLPVEVRVCSDEIGNLLYLHEKPSLHVDTDNQTQIPYSWKVWYSIADYFGNTRMEKTRRLKVPVGKGRYSINLEGLEEGWYKAEIALIDEKGGILWKEATSFVLLPSDTRKAKDESPYGMWWSRYYHLGEGRLDVVGPIYQKLGMRHCNPSVVFWKFFGPTYPVEELKKYDITVSMIKSLLLLNRQRIIPEPLNEAKARAEIRLSLEQFKGVKRAMIYHEHRLNIPEELDFPPELLGEKPPVLNEKVIERQNIFKENAIKLSKIYRELAPEVKLYHGNSFRVGFLIQLYLRGGFPKEYLDVLSLEHTGGKSMLPESQPSTKPSTKSPWLLRKMMDIYGYGDIPISASYENIGVSSDPIVSSLHEQAQFYVRNILYALAYGIDIIHAGGVSDGGNAYYYTLWGNTGFCYRKPRLTPKPSFAAVATLTQVLDCASYKRYLDTGSSSVFCLEFQRGDRLVYALWTVRGRREVGITVQKDCRYSLINIVGSREERKTRNKGISLEVSPDPCYLVLPHMIRAIRLGRAVHENLNFKELKVIYPMATVSNWKNIEKRDTEYEKLDTTVPRRKGRFTFNDVNDREKGKCIEITLVPQTEIPDVCPQYLILEPKNVVKIQERPEKVGLWVKGNSCWGRILLEFKDDRGRTWKLTKDPKSKTYINFDGWQLIHIGLPERTPSGHYGQYGRDWSCFAGSYPESDSDIKYPIQLSRLIIEMRDNIVHVTEMERVRDKSIRIKNLVAIYE